MKRTIAALVAGLVLGGTGTAVAASQFWAKSWPGVARCESATSPTLGVVVACQSKAYTPAYSFSISRRAVTLGFNGKLIFNCYTRYTPPRCQDNRP